ncbi:SUKH-4 family immunity protein [Streptomyces sp. JW3]|uniref:SUKH-4 family immunity protein n=1 Tax=Streptomyces sp. JW3 TaxID=3456955 RepID=UPI003FA41F60
MGTGGTAGPAYGHTDIPGDTMRGATSDTTITNTTNTTADRPAVSLLTLVRDATSVADPSWARGAGRRVPAGNEMSLLWKTSVLIGCLLLATSRRTAPAADLPYRFLDREFGRGRVSRFEEVDFPSCLTHEPTRRFLRETGLPDEAFPFRLAQDGDMPLPTLAEWAADDDRPAAFPTGADRLVRLGALADGAAVVLDAGTGAVLTWHRPTGTLTPLAPDLPAFTLTLWARHRAACVSRP